MNAKQKLRKLIEQFPEPVELREMFGTMQKDSDRSIAIVSASIIDVILQRFLEVSFIKKDIGGMIFKDQGPLSTFHAKILMAAAFGLIPDEVYTELMLLKTIRNAFAHSVINMDFETPEIVDLMKQSWLVQGMAENAPKAFKVYGKDGFLGMASLICQILNRDLVEAGGEMVYHRAG